MTLEGYKTYIGIIGLLFSAFYYFLEGRSEQAITAASAAMALYGIRDKQERIDKGV